MLLEAEAFPRVLAGGGEHITYGSLERQPVCDGDRYGSCIVSPGGGQRPCGYYDRCKRALVGVTIFCFFLILRRRRSTIEDLRITSAAKSSRVPFSYTSPETKTRNSSPLFDLCRRFTMLEIRMATGDFDESFVIGNGTGGFGNVYERGWATASTEEDVLLESDVEKWNNRSSITRTEESCGYRADRSCDHDGLFPFSEILDPKAR
ncbi:Rapid ALkalinization Factor [Dillenia turbinata]|uniref:Rapid ALkalinization Factor n=1 Tax=Dillenia turbinata TaxID=194707 RepID=A0AAN8YUZ0_9MAGN